MTGTFGLGLLLALASGVASGNSMLAMKFARRWRWENIWLVFSLLALGAVPWTLALILVKNLGQVYRSLDASQLLVPILFGAGWGCAHFLYGVSMSRLGIALGSAIIMGLVAVLGTAVPLIVLKPETLNHFRGAAVILAMVLAGTGIALCGRAGSLRDGFVPSQQAARSRGYGVSLALAVACGLLSPMFNFAFAFGQPVALAAVQHGNSPLIAGYAIWPLALSGGFLPNVAFCLYLLKRNGSWAKFTQPGPDVVLTAAMAVLWTGSFALYGMSTAALGELGTSAGWGITQVFAVLAANTAGIVAGEWKGAAVRALHLLVIGVWLLAAALGFLAAANL